jgi:hypothetical protein
MARAWIELEGEHAGWGPARVRVAALSRAGYVCEVLTGSGPLVLVLTGRTLTVSVLLAIGGPPAVGAAWGAGAGFRVPPRS